MFYAEDTDGQIIPAARGETATCPGCREDLLGKSGAVVTTPYWSHRAGTDCDDWYDPANKMSEWHRTWQAQVTRGRCEYPMKVDGVRHRADIKALDGQIIEIQNSGISAPKIEEREQFYGANGGMAWIWNTIKAIDEHRLLLNSSNDWELPKTFRTFTWDQPWASIGFCKSRTLFDLGRGYLLDAVVEERKPFRGWGLLVDQETVVEWINDGPPETLTDPRIALRERRKAEREQQIAYRQQHQPQQRSTGIPRRATGYAVSQGISAAQGGWGACDRCGYWMMLGSGLPTTCAACRSRSGRAWLNGIEQPQLQENES